MLHWDPKHLNSAFQTKDLGNLRYFLGLEVARRPDGLVLSQRKYYTDLLQDVGYSGCKPADTPMDVNHKLSTHGSGTDPVLTNPEYYRCLVGKLIYLTVTRPDISFAVGVVPLMIGVPQLVFAPTLVDTLLPGVAKKQSVVARSSAEAEYRAMTSVVSKLTWLEGLLNDTTEDNTEDIAAKDQPVLRKSSVIVSAAHHKSKKKKKKKDMPKSAKFKAEESLDSILEELSIEVKASPVNISPNANDRKENVLDATKKHGRSSILKVDPKYLKAENELRKIFGSRVVSSLENNEIGGNSSQMYGGRRAIHHPRRTILVTPSSYWSRWDGSLSMELVEVKDGLNYFRYVHSAAYSHAQESFEVAKSANDLNAIAAILAHYPYHIESLLTFSEVFKFSGEHQSSADVLAKSLFALECAWHPLFTPMQGNCQLKFIHDTNKQFFTALFCHMKNLDRRGCHRSALEVCKLLLSLDYDDPKGALLCIDYFSLRAQEYRWLEDFAGEYRCDNSLWMFPNFLYSLAFTRFFIEHDESSTDSTEQTEKATSTDLMKQALMLHPLVLQKLVAKTPLKESIWTQILNNSFFGSAKAGSPTLEHLINIYAERSYLIWRYPELQGLLKVAALQVMESLKESTTEARNWACVREEAFPSEKNEYSHLLVSDFSDSIPTIPPEELRHFMVRPHLHEIRPDVEGDVNPEIAHVPREVTGGNAAVMFFESLMPWFNFVENQGLDEDHDPNIQ
ncbi:hypothetical protein KSP39_PZI023746 [Platanthera zijinensis]|uniref:Reverse transcriptase Ty1/copia-type domain-containing protein n=1 Tax=Platanthera zijinensis TaxID=2320716 RepID=A0AAP0AT88_9ASPA